MAVLGVSQAVGHRTSQSSQSCRQLWLKVLLRFWYKHATGPLNELIDQKGKSKGLDFSYHNSNKSISPLLSDGSRNPEDDVVEISFTERRTVKRSPTHYEWGFCFQQDLLA